MPKTESKERASFLDRLKGWPIWLKVTTGVLAFLLLASMAQAVSGDEDSQAQADEAPEKDSSESPAPEAGKDDPAPAEIPDGIDAQIAGLAEVEGLEGAEFYFSEGDESYPYSTVHIDTEVEIGLTVVTTCRAAQQATIDGLEFLRDRVPADYDRVMFSFHVRGEADATGDQPIIGLASAVYDRETVEAIDSDSVNTRNVWQARDEGTTSEECQ